MIMFLRLVLQVSRAMICHHCIALSVCSNYVLDPGTSRYQIPLQIIALLRPVAKASRIKNIISPNRLSDWSESLVTDLTVLAAKPTSCRLVGPVNLNRLT